MPLTMVMASTTGKRPEAGVVEQLVDGLAQERDARDDEGADEEDEEQQGAEGEGLDDGPGLALARAGVARPKCSGPDAIAPMPHTAARAIEAV